MKELWKTIKNFSLYEVSNHGRIRNRKSKRIRKNGYGNGGYPRIDLWSNGKSKNFDIHRLVAIAFIPNPNRLKCVNHKDGNKKNNYYKNLEWITHGDNQRHAYKHNLKLLPRGSRAGNAKLTWLQVDEIRDLYKMGVTQVSLSKQYNVNRVTIQLVVNFKTWII